MQLSSTFHQPNLITMQFLHQPTKHIVATNFQLKAQIGLYEVSQPPAWLRSVAPNHPAQALETAVLNGVLNLWIRKFSLYNLQQFILGTNMRIQNQTAYWNVMKFWKNKDSEWFRIKLHFCWTNPSLSLHMFAPSCFDQAADWSITCLLEPINPVRAWGGDTSMPFWDHLRSGSADTFFLFDSCRSLYRSWNFLKATGWPMASHPCGCD